MPRSVKIASGVPTAILTIIVGVIASLGQIEFAREHDFVRMIVIDKFDVTPYLAPFVFDLAVAALFNLGTHVAYRNMTPWPAWSAGLALAGLSIYTNTQHTAAFICAGASLVLMVIWLLKLIYRYLELERERGNRSAGTPKFLFSELMQVAPRVAWHARIIAIRKPLTARVAELEAMGEKTTVRDLAIQMAELYIEILDDREVAELKNTKLWQYKARQLARRRARIVAWDEVTRRVGRDVIDRQGIKVTPVEYDETPAKTKTKTKFEAKKDDTVVPPPDDKPKARRPVPPPPDKTEEAPPQEWFVKHAARIAVVQKVHENWVDDPSLTSVRQVKALAPRFPEVAMGNAIVAKEVAACIRELRRQALADRAESK